MKKYLVMLVLLVCSMSNAATTVLSPGASIQSAINAAASGDTIVLKSGTYAGGFTINKPMTLMSEVKWGAKLTGSTSQTAITMYANNITVDGIYMDSFMNGVANWGVKISGLRILNCYIGNAQYHVAVFGSNILIQDNELYRVRYWAGQGDANYIWALDGTGITIRGNYAHGTRLGDGVNQSDICPAGYTAYDAGPCAHVDFYQAYTNNGEVTDGILIENNYATDFIDAVYTTDEGPGAIRNLTARNNVFIGTDYKYKDAGTPLQTRQPAWGIACSYGTGCEGTNEISNNTLINITLPIRLNDGTRATVSENLMSSFGQGYTLDRNSISNIQFTGGNAWNNVWSYQAVSQPQADKLTGCTVLSGTDACTVNPQFVNIQSPLGADNIPFTSDDGWPSQLAGGYGAQSIVVAPPPTPNTPPVANAGADQVFNLTSGQTTVSVTLSGSGTDSDGAVVAYTWSGNPDPTDLAAPTMQLGQGNYVFTLVVIDDKGAQSAGDSVSVTVNPYVNMLENRVTELENRLNQIVTIPGDSVSKGGVRYYRQGKKTP